MAHEHDFELQLVCETCGERKVPPITELLIGTPLTAAEVRSVMERFLRDQGWEKDETPDDDVVRASFAWLNRDVDDDYRTLTDALRVALRRCEERGES